jgi:hypothetical protein
MGPMSSGRRLVKIVLMLTGYLLLSGCASEIMFRSSFNANAVGGPPAVNQAIGTIAIDGAPGSVVIVPAPVNTTPPQPTGHWAQIRRDRGPGNPVATMHCNLSASRGDGSYSVLAVLFIPSGSGLATVEFATARQAAPASFGFMHLDFLENNRVRVNDNSTQVFGTFPRDQFFTLAVTLNITASSATANLQLLGGTASGGMDINLVTQAAPLFLVRQFGIVRFSKGFDWGGFFDVTDIIVTRKN